MIVGESRTTQVTFRDQDGDLVNPAQVDLTVRAPDGTTTTPAPEHPSVGVYESEIEFDQVGIWRWQWSGSTPSGTVIVECYECARASTLAGVGS